VSECVRDRERKQHKQQRERERDTHRDRQNRAPSDFEARRPQIVSSSTKRPSRPASDLRARSASCPTLAVRAWQSAGVQTAVRFSRAWSPPPRESGQLTAATSWNDVAQCHGLCLMMNTLGGLSLLAPTADAQVQAEEEVECRLGHGDEVSCRTGAAAA
jgi:hypothetical protein